MRYFLTFILFIILIISAPAQQSHPVVTEADYARAESFLSANTTPLLSHAMERPHWLPDGRLLYQNRILDGFEFIIVDPVKKIRSRAFDHDKLAQSLSSVMDTTYDPLHLPFRHFEFIEDGKSINFTVQGQKYSCDLQKYHCTVVKKSKYDPGRNEVISPNKKLAAFIRVHSAGYNAVSGRFV